jgi:hypothetical protein
MVEPDLTTERQRLAQKLGRLFVWLEKHVGHPDYDRRERIWLSTLRAYEVTCAKLMLGEG